MNPIRNFLNWRAQRHQEYAWGFMRLVPNADQRAQSRTLRRAFIADAWWLLVKAAAIVGAIALWHVAAGCRSKSLDSIAPPPVTAAVAPLTAKTLGHVTKAQAHTEALIQKATEAPQTPLAEAMPLIQQIKAEIDAAIAAGTIANTAAAAKDGEASAGQDAIKKLQKQNATLRSDLDKERSDFQRSMKWWRLIIALVSAAAIALAIYVFKSPKLAISIAVSAVLTLVALWAFAWIDRHMLLIIGSAGAAAAAWIIGETVIRKFKGGLSWGSAFVTAISTGPSQDLADIRSPAPVPA